MQLVYAMKELDWWPCDHETDTLANSEDPDKMLQHNVCKDKIDLQRKKLFFLEIITCDPSIYGKFHWYMKG